MVVIRQISFAFATKGLKVSRQSFLANGAPVEDRCGMDRRQMDFKVTVGLYISLIHLGVFLLVPGIHDHREHRLRHRQMADICRRKILQYWWLRQPSLFLWACHAPHLFLSCLLRSWHSLFTCGSMGSNPLTPNHCQGSRHRLFRSLHHQFRPTANQCLLGLRHRDGIKVEVVGQFLWTGQYSS